MSSATRRQHGVNVCTTCSAPYLQPVDWQRLDFFTWKITVSCPNCQRVEDLVLTEDEVRDLYNSVQLGLQSMKAALKEMEKEAFETECRTLITALRSGNVYPMDF